ncbi:SMI1/KNR4 family protein [Amycolatopsis saalfeldensis]|uniref:SMI1 / KNR4 family (SUKH-1) n=1 Tax=Amycolatopsis saalfeldensis TaxID=394193 RepID=A0A1H8YNW8_9PSEU|nr:SMI1/KNR4 family protein [Amycolatopsis saalfeldensis]SEP53773.1 hypothetical protein SAMN04489732_13112 [Amycolatopsis saalfeldensis]
MSQPRAQHSIDEIARVAQWNGRIQPGRDWKSVEQEIGTTLPDDYKELLNRFPSGSYRNAITVSNPVDSRTDYAKFIREDIHGTLEILGDEGLEYIEDTGYRTFPELGGLLPWGHDGQGGMFCWITEPADPNQWRVAYYSQGLGEWREHSGPMTDVIWKVLTGTGDDNIFRWDLAHELAIFRVPSTLLANGEWLPYAEYR